MLAGIITDYAFGLGYMLLAGMAYMIRDWRKLQLAISAPGFLLIFYIWWEIQKTSMNIRSTVYSFISMTRVHECPLCDPPVLRSSCFWLFLLPPVLSLSVCCMLSLSPVRVVPQSARWLLTKNRKEEAIALLRKAALVNGRVLPPAVQV